MDKKTLKRANDLNQVISEFEEALNCFEWSDPLDETKKYSTNPSLIIEFDDCDDGREQIAIPMTLSNLLIDILKTEIKKGLEEAKNHFKLL